MPAPLLLSGHLHSQFQNGSIHHCHSPCWWQTLPFYLWPPVNEFALNILSSFLCFWHFPTHGYLYLCGLLSLFLPASWLAGTDLHQKMWEDHPVTWEICLIFIWHWLQVLTFSLGEKDRLKEKRDNLRIWQRLLKVLSDQAGHREVLGWADALSWPTVSLSLSFSFVKCWE